MSIVDHPNYSDFLGQKLPQTSLPGRIVRHRRLQPGAIWLWASIACRGANLLLSYGCETCAGVKEEVVSDSEKFIDANDCILVDTVSLSAWKYPLGKAEGFPSNQILSYRPSLQSADPTLTYRGDF